MEAFTENQKKSVAYMMFLLGRTALYMDLDDDKVEGYSKALEEVADSLRDQGLNPLGIALQRLKSTN